MELKEDIPKPNEGISSFIELKNDPLNFIRTFCSNISDEMYKQKEILKLNIDEYYNSMFDQLKSFEKECELSFEKRDLNYYDLFKQSDQDKIQDLKSSLLLNRTCEFKLAEFNRAICGTLEIVNKYQAEEEELQKWTESKEWKPFKITEYRDIIDDINVTDVEWLSSMKDFLVKEGLSEKTVNILIKNSNAENWPNALKTKELRQKNMDKIKEISFCNF